MSAGVNDRPGAPGPVVDAAGESLRAEVEQLGRIVDEQERTVAALRHELFLHTSSIGWRLQLRLDPVRTWMLGIPGLRQIYRVFYRGLELWVDEGWRRIAVQIGVKLGRLVRGREFLVEDRDRVARHRVEDQYEHWIRHYGTAPGADDMRAAIARFTRTPLVTVLTPVSFADMARVGRAIATLQAQAYERWELCLALPAGVSITEELDAARRADARVRIAESAGDVPTPGDALGLAQGEFVGLLAVDDVLAPEALFALVARLQQEPADVVYSDEDWISAEERRDDPFFKPDWSPDLLLATNYLERFGLVRRALVDEVGGLTRDFGAGQSYDLMLRVTEHTERIAHVPQVLYHRRRHPTTLEAVLAKHAAAGDERRALENALSRRGRRGRATLVFSRSGARSYATRWDLTSRPLVSIIIPTRNKQRLLQTTIESIRARTAYDRYEILVIDNGSTEPDAVQYLASLAGTCQVHQWREPFNYSAINNFGVARSSGEQVLFLNNDVEVIGGDWLDAMLEHAERPEVGVVGARLLYADGRIQHAGVVVGINRAAANAFRSWPGETLGSPRLADLARNCSAVTGACMMVPRRIFDEVGGFDEDLRVVLNDVDLCLRIRQKGYLIVYTPHALLYHYEGSSRGLLHPPPDQKRFEAKWPEALARVDPYYNPNLTDDRDDWSLRVEPGDEKASIRTDPGSRPVQGADRDRFPRTD